jgi:NIL domain
MNNQPQWQTMTNPEKDLYLDQSGLDRITTRRIKIRVPKQYINEPIVSRLGSFAHLKVNIISALLGSNSSQDGWFDLQLQGNSQGIENALSYLADLDVEVWYDSAQTLEEADNW